MNDAYRRLSSSLPPRVVAPAGAFASDPRNLRGWIEALPMANFPVAARKLLEGLRQLNRQRVDGAQRLEALESLRVPLMQLAASTDRQIVGTSFPLPTQKVELGALALNFQGELALGYRTALVELCAPAGAVGFLRGKSVALAAVRALQHGHEHLARAYLLYRTPPEGAWRNLHDVHRFAMTARLDERAVDDPILMVPATTRSLYVTALLLALANPYRYTQREQADVAALVRTLAPHAELRDGNGADNDVVVPENTDQGPGYIVEEREDGQRHPLALRLDGVVAFVAGQIAAMPPGVRSASFRVRGGALVQVDADLVQRVMGALTARRRRNHARLEGGYLLDSVVGLNDLHFVLAGGEDFEGFMRRVRGQAISLSESDRVAAWRAAATDNARGSRLPARVLDQSLGGYRLLWERGSGGESIRIRVSELIGLALPDTGDARQDWMVGVVRWIRIDDIGRVDAGVELLSRRALPVGVRVIDGSDLRASLRGLLLSSMKAPVVDGYHALLTPTEVDRAVPELELSIATDAQGPAGSAHVANVARLRLLEATGIYQYFALPAVDDAESDTADPAVESADTSLGV